MAQQMFCIKCGKEAVSGTVFCEDCISKGEQLASAPGVVTFEICPSCGKVKGGSSWREQGDLGKYMASELRKSVRLSGDASLKSLEIENLDPSENSSNVILALSLVTHGITKEERIAVRVRVEGNTCPTCNRRSGHYFESTIQLRSMGKTREEVIGRVLSYATKLCEEYERTEKGFFVSGIKGTKGGVDITLSSNTVGAALAKKVAKKFGAEVVPTRKLFGRKNGKEVYRTTFLVRVAMFSSGDYVEYRNSQYLVTGATDVIELLPLKGGAPVRIKPSESSSLKFLGGRELEEWVEVVSDEHGQVLVRDPSTLEEVNVLCMHDHPRGSRMKVVRLGDQLVETVAR